VNSNAKEKDMKMKFMLNLLMTSAVCLIFSTVASAQATRTWVSGVGNDADPCSRTAPCKTFSGAMTKTAAGGEINVLDPGGYGTVLINKAITIDGGTGSGWGSILASGTNGVIVNAGANDVIILRHLSINGVNQSTSPGVNGIRFLAGKTLIVDSCEIFGFNTHGIDMNVSTQSELIVQNTNITRCGNNVTSPNPGYGIRAATTLTPVNVRIDNCRIEKCGTSANGNSGGVDATNGSRATIANSFLSHNVTAIMNESPSGNTEVNIYNTTLVYNTTAIQAGNGAGQTTTTRIADNLIANNTAGISIAGGNVCSAGGNVVTGNGASAPPTAGCAITRQ
jgi:hypothetical protein